MKLLKQIDTEEAGLRDREKLIKVPSLRRRLSERHRAHTPSLEPKNSPRLPSVARVLTLKVPLESFVSPTQRSKDCSPQFSPGEDLVIAHCSGVTAPPAPKLLGLQDSVLENPLPSSLPPDLEIQPTISDPLQPHAPGVEQPNVKSISDGGFSGVETNEGKPLPGSCITSLDVYPLHTDLPPERSAIEVRCWIISPQYFHTILNAYHTIRKSAFVIFVHDERGLLFNHSNLLVMESTCRAQFLFL